MGNDVYLTLDVLTTQTRTSQTNNIWRVQMQKPLNAIWKFLL